jgi:hypothetical protein
MRNGTAECTEYTIAFGSMKKTQELVFGWLQLAVAFLAFT